MKNKRKNIVLHPDILQTLTDCLPDMLWIKDTEGHYLFANQSICQNLLMAENTDEPIGKTDIFFAQREREKHPENPEWHTFGELCLNSDLITAKENRPMRFEEYGNVKGKLLYLEVHKAPFYDDNGEIIGILGSGRDITEAVMMKKQLEKQKLKLKYQAQHDALTDLPNRMLFQDRLDHILRKCERTDETIALFFIDLDHFKDINDIHGHATGDKILQLTALRLAALTRKMDTLSRLGGDEFTLIVEDVKQKSDLSFLADKILKNINKPITIDNMTHHVTASIGICLNSDSHNSASEMLKHADSAMYRAKEAGKNKCEFYSPELTEMARKRVKMENELRIALNEEQFEVYFQPKIQITSGEIHGAEALVRWQHPQGLRAPDSFIPSAESTGMIIEIDRWVYRYSLKKLSQWKQQGLVNDHFTLSLNLSPRQLETDDFLVFFIGLIKENNLDPRCIELEITETQIMENLETTKIQLQDIEAIGIRLAIDDFGTGYSSLAYLKKLRFDTLKIDRSFIMDVPTKDEDSSIVLAILNMAKTLGLHVVAEGVETQQQLDFLRCHQCECAQGYFFEKPQPPEQFEALIKAPPG